MKTSKYAQFATEASRRMFIGGLVKHVKGEWQMGSAKDLIPPDQRFIAVMATLTVGYLKWGGGKPIDSQMGLVADGIRPPQRNDLEDLDSKTWETDEDGDRNDPWQKTTLLVLASASEPHELYTFSTTTVGGQSAIGDLCEAHARTTEGVGQYPVVTLGTGAYDHKIKSRGRVHVPVFRVVDCVEAGPFNAMVAEERGGAGFIPTSPPALSTPDAVAITSGVRTPPVPPAPPPGEYVGPEDGAAEGDNAEYAPF